MATANPQVKQLQQALTQYAKITGFAAANPGPADGFVGTQTLNAVIAMIPLLPKIPSEVKTLATLGPLLLINADAKAQAVKYVTQYAGMITNAIIGLATYQAGTGKLPTTQPPGTPATPTQLTVSTVLPTKLPGGAGQTIFFLDRGRGLYRVAVRVGFAGLGAAYTEVAPSATRPASGTEVTKSDFYKATGRWYATWWGISAIVGGGAAALSAGILGFRLLRR
jgi:hypothetical protein